MKSYPRTVIVIGHSKLNQPCALTFSVSWAVSGKYSEDQKGFLKLILPVLNYSKSWKVFQMSGFEDAYLQPSACIYREFLFFLHQVFRSLSTTNKRKKKNWRALKVFFTNFLSSGFTTESGETSEVWTSWVLIVQGVSWQQWIVVWHEIPVWIHEIHTLLPQGWVAQSYQRISVINYEPLMVSYSVPAREKQKAYLIRLSECVMEI